jgi:hypothetical protein
MTTISTYKHQHGQATINTCDEGFSVSCVDRYAGAGNQTTLATIDAAREHCSAFIETLNARDFNRDADSGWTMLERDCAFNYHFATYASIIGADEEECAGLILLIDTEFGEIACIHDAEGTVMDNANFGFNELEKAIAWMKDRGSRPIPEQLVDQINRRLELDAHFAKELDHA